MIIYYNEELSEKIRVFISSTFRDMQKERNVIVNSVFPTLRRRFRKKMIDIMEIDLRWGISEQDIKDMLLLEICIGETLNCTPYFVGLIGDFYGTIAKEEEILMLPPAYKKAIGMKNRTDVPKDVSLTELEMRAGAFVKGNTEFSRFFIRDTETNEPDKEKLNNLVENISDNGFTVTHYTSIDEFETIACDELCEYIDNIVPSEPVPPYGDPHYISHLKMLKDKNNGYVPNNDITAEAEEILSSENRLYIHGGKGSGKSALISYLAFREGVERDGDIFFHFYDADEESLSSENLYARLRLYIENISGMSSKETDNYNGIIDILKRCELKNNITLYFDAVEKFSDISTSRKLFVLSELNPKVKVVESGAAMYSHIKNKEKISPAPLSEEQIRQIVISSLYNYGKKLEKEQMEIIEGANSCRNPLFLEALISQLILYGNHETFNDFFAKTVTATGFDSLFKIIIQRLHDYFVERNFNAETIYQALALIIYSKFGIPESELQILAGFRPIERSVFLCAIDLFTNGNDCLIRFNHDLIISAVKEILSNKEKDYMDFVAKSFVIYFEEKDEDDGFYWRKYSELPNQLHRLHRYEDLAECISSYPTFSYLAKKQFTSLVKYLAEFIPKAKGIFERLKPYIQKSDTVLFANAFCQAGAHSAAISLIINAAKADDTGILSEDDYENTPAVLADLIEASNFDTKTKNSLFAVASRSYYKLAVMHYKPAVFMYERMLDFYKKNYPSDLAGYVSCAYLLGVTYKSMGDAVRARSCLEECAKIIMENNIKNDVSYWVYAVYGNILFFGGEVEKALKMLSASADDARFMFGDNSQELAWSFSYGWPIYYAIGQKMMALSMTDIAHEIYTENYGDRGPKIAWSSMNRGVCRHFSEDYENAKSLYELSIRENNAVLPEEKRPHVYTLTTYSNLASLEFEKGNIKEAFELIDFALTNSVEKNGKEHPYTANITLTAGIIKRDENLIKAAIDIYSKINTPDIYFAKLSLARILAACSKDEEAESVIEALYEESQSKKNSTNLILYLIIETLEKISWDTEKYDLKSQKDSLVKFKDYKHYIFHNNTSNLVRIPHI